MLNQWELWACANHYVKKHGEDAAVVAEMPADELMDAGDLDGAKNFQTIVRRINALLTPPKGGR